MGTQAGLLAPVKPPVGREKDERAESCQTLCAAFMITVQHIERALRGERESMMTLLDELERIIHARVAKVLCRRGTSNRSGIRNDLIDVSHDVLEKLFKENGAILRSWDPALGPLAAYVGRIAENLATSSLRKIREQLSIDDEHDSAPPSSQDPHRLVESRELYRAILEGMRARLTTPTQRTMFQMIVVDELSVDEICRRSGMTPDAVHQARTRLRRLGEEVRAQVMSEPEPSRLSARNKV